MKKNTSSTKITILCNGVFPKGKEALQEMNKANFLLCCDGAANQAKNNNYNPDLIIGDMDSIKNSNDFDCPIKKIEEQHSNDLNKAIIWAQDNKYKEAIILGAVGKREDHMIANIFSLFNMNFFISVKVITDFGEFVVFDPRNIELENNVYKKTFSSYRGQQISIFCNNENIFTKSNGLKYEINGIKSNTLYELSLNESISDNFSIGIKSNNTKLIIYKAFK